MRFIFLNEDRKQHIESLEFFFFLGDLYSHVLEKQEKTNPHNTAINAFSDAIKSYYCWQFYRIDNYSNSLSDYIFWKYMFFGNIVRFIWKKCKNLCLTN